MYTTTASTLLGDRSNSSPPLIAALLIYSPRERYRTVSFSLFVAGSRCGLSKPNKDPDPGDVQKVPQHRAIKPHSLFICE